MACLDRMFGKNKIVRESMNDEDREALYQAVRKEAAKEPMPIPTSDTSVAAGAAESEVGTKTRPSEYSEQEKASYAEMKRAKKAQNIVDRFAGGPRRE